MLERVTSWMRDSNAPLELFIDENKPRNQMYFYRPGSTWIVRKSAKDGPNIINLDELDGKTSWTSNKKFSKTCLFKWKIEGYCERLYFHNGFHQGDGD